MGWKLLTRTEYTYLPRGAPFCADVLIAEFVRANAQLDHEVTRSVGVHWNLGKALKLKHPCDLVLVPECMLASVKTRIEWPWTTS